MAKQLEVLNQISEIVTDKELKDWTAGELRKVAELVDFDVTLETDDELLNSSRHTVTGAIVNFAGNLIINGDWGDCNCESSEDNYELQHICNFAFNFIENWVNGKDSRVNNTQIVEILDSIKELEKDTGITFELFSARLTEAVEALEDDRQTFLVEQIRSEDFDSDDLPTLFEVVKFNPMKEDLTYVFAGEIIDLSDSAKISLAKAEDVEAQLYYDTDLDEFTTI